MLHFYSAIRLQSKFLWRQEQIPGIVKVKSHEFFINFFTKVVLYELFWWKFSAFNNFCMTCFEITSEHISEYTVESFAAEAESMNVQLRWGFWP